MKKYIFLGTIFINTFFLNAQVLVLSNDTGNIPNGGIIEVTGDTSSGTIIKAKIKITNTSQNSLDIKVRKIENSIISGTKNYFCFNDHCYAPSVYVSPSILMLEPGATDTSFVGEYNPQGHLGMSSITYSFFNIDFPYDSAWVEVHYIALPMSINENHIAENKFSNPYPNPAKSYTVFSYQFTDDVCEVKFVLRNLLGNKIKEFSIKDKENKFILDTSGLRGGMYFYSVIIDGELLLTRKLVVHH